MLNPQSSRTYENTSHCGWGEFQTSLIGMNGSRGISDAFPAFSYAGN